jgi:hypothetical protein
MAITPAINALAMGVGSIGTNLPGPQSAKNAMLSPAATDLGMGDALKQQLQDELDERKKQQNPANAASGLGNSLISSPAVLSLFTNNRGF